MRRIPLIGLAQAGEGPFGMVKRIVNIRAADHAGEEGSFRESEVVGVLIKNILWAE